jgi:P22 coat protein - gene protein 5
LAFLTTDKILDKALDRYATESVILQLADGRYDKEWGEKETIGDQIAIRLPIYARSRRGEEADPQSLDEQAVFLKIPAAYGSDSYITDRQLSMELTDFTDQVMNPHMDAVVSAVSQAACKTVALGVSNFVGTPGVLPTSLSTYTAAGRLLTQGGTPTGLTSRYMLLDAAMDEAAAAAGRTLYNPTMEIAEQYKTGSMTGKLGWFSNFTWYMEQALYQQTVGQLGTLQGKVQGANQLGNTITTSGWSHSITGLLNPGDKLWFTGAFMVHPVLGVAYNDLAPFTVAQTVNSDSSGNATITLTESIQFGTPYANISAQIADQAPIYVWGQLVAGFASIAGITFTLGIAMHKSALVYASPDLILPQDVDRLSGRARSDKMKVGMRVWRASDVNKGRVITRLDMLMGFLVGQPRKACLVCSVAV